MPIYSRLQLRQSLGQDWLRDTTVGTTTGSCGAIASGAYIVDSSAADPSLDGQSMYNGATFRVNGQDRRIATFHTGSGMWLTLQTLASPVLSGASYEIHERLSGDEKGRLLDRVISQVWRRQEVPFWGSANMTIYSLGQDVGHIFDAWYYSSPGSGSDRDREHLTWWQERTTATGRELNIAPSIAGSAQLVVEAQMYLSLGSADTATVNVPDRDWVLDGAAALAYDLLARRSPGQEAGMYRAEAARYAKRWTLGMSRWLPQSQERRQLEYPY